MHTGQSNPSFTYKLTGSELTIAA